MRPRLPESVRTFHSALDELEREIVRLTSLGPPFLVFCDSLITHNFRQISAKSVLLRDLRLKQHQSVAAAGDQTVPLPEPPLEPASQTESAMAINLDTSPQSANTAQGTEGGAVPKPMAPFPDMGSDLQMSPQKETSVQEENTPNISTASNGVDDKHGADASLAGAANAAAETDKPLGDGTPGSAGTADKKLNFTDMEFSLAPVQGGSQGQANGAGEAALDLSNFSTQDSGDDLLSFLSSNQNDQHASFVSGNSAPSGGEQRGNTEEDKEQPPLSSFDTKFPIDDMDFDFSLDGATAGSFDDLMEDRDGTLEMRATDDFDTSMFFDKQDET